MLPEEMRVRVERNLKKEKEKEINGLPVIGASRLGVNPRAAAKPEEKEKKRKRAAKPEERTVIRSPASSETSARTCLRKGSASSGTKKKNLRN